MKTKYLTILLTLVLVVGTISAASINRTAYNVEEKIHDYTITVVSTGCDGYVVPFIVGGMTGWHFQQMQWNPEKTVENGYNPTYDYCFSAAEGTAYQIVSGLMDEMGEIATQPVWNDDAYLIVLDEGAWTRYNPSNSFTGIDTNIVYDLRVDTMGWARCYFHIGFGDNYDFTMGICIGYGDYPGGSSVTITASPKDGYHFIQWLDGNTENPRTIYLTQDTIMRPIFARNPIITYIYNNEQGSVSGATTTPAGKAMDSITFTAIPNYGYHFVQWADESIENPRTIYLTQDTIMRPIFARNPIITYIYNNEQGSVSGATTTPAGKAMDSITFTAIPNYGYHFVQWADESIENPRTIYLTQDTIMEAFFDYLLTDKCGRDLALEWTLDTTKMALEITGKGALSENYTYGTFIESLTIGNEITQIGAAAFYRFEKLKNVILGSSVKVLESEAFRKCYAIETITCYSQRPPTVNEGALYGLGYSTIVYVPADYLNTYIMHDAWGLYDVRPLGAISTETTEVKVTPSETTAEVVWPTISGAATYELVIKDKDGNVICTLIFNANGQLTQIAFNAPSRDHAPQQTQAAGFSFTVTGLEGGTSYDLTMTSKDSNGSTLDEKTISFTTSGEQGFEDVNASTTIHKLLHNGQILILRGDKTYTLTGQEIIVP